MRKPGTSTFLNWRLPRRTGASVGSLAHEGEATHGSGVTLTHKSWSLVRVAGGSESPWQAACSLEAVGFYMCVCEIKHEFLL